MRNRQRRTRLQRRSTVRWLLGIKSKHRYRYLMILVASVFVGVGIGLAGLGIGVAVAYNRLTAGLPSPDRIIQRDVFKTTTIYDRNGEVLYETWDPQEGKRTMVRLDELPRAVISATLATEDATFYENPGFDIRSIARAMWQNLRGQTIVSGASTITQQLVRNTVFDPTERYEQSYVRKLREAVLAYQLSQRYSKDQILEMYLNEVPYGNLAYGIEAAAQVYFGKSARDLTVGEAALLAGLPQSPVKYNPLTSPKGAEGRQREVLNLMVRHDFLSEEDAAAARAEKLTYLEPRYDIKAPHFSLYVRDLLEQRFGQRKLYYGGLKVYTTLDLHLQEAAEQIVKRHLATIAQHNAHDAALVALDPRTGEVLAMVGSADYFDKEIDGQVNMAIAERQPGSTLKPFTYYLAFQRGLSPGSIVIDRAMSFPGGEGQPPYQPKNHDGQFRGPVTLRQALGNSLNIPAVQMLQFVGIPSLLDILHKVGITSLNDRNRYGLALTLGGGEVKLVDLVFAYTTLANGGRQTGRPVPAADLEAGRRRNEPAFILRVEDADGVVLEDYQPGPAEELLSPQLTFMIDDILSDDAARTGTYGPHSVLELTRPAAAKTGTTDDYRDAWTIGFTPDLVTGVWVGNADNRPMDNIFGATGAGRVWHDFMEEALKGWPPVAFERPAGLVKATVSTLTGLRPSPGEPTAADWFLAANVPQQWAMAALPTATPALPTAMPALPTAVPRVAEKPTARPRPSPVASTDWATPNVVGLPEAEARQRIEAAGLSNTYTNYQGPRDVPESALNAVPPGHVLSQSPAPGTALPPGTTVYLAVRKL